MKKQKEDSAKQRQQRAKRPYVKPAIITDDTFETLALSCGLAGPGCVLVDRS